MTRFSFTAQSDPQILMRLLNLFAQRGLVCENVRAEVLGNRISGTIQANMPDMWQAEIVAEKMRQLPYVNSVDMIHDGEAGAAPMSGHRRSAAR